MRLSQTVSVVIDGKMYGNISYWINRLSIENYSETFSILLGGFPPALSYVVGRAQHPLYSRAVARRAARALHNLME